MLVINYLKLKLRQLKKNDQLHICKNCKIDITDIKRTNGNIPSIELQSVDKQEHDTTIAESLLIEENFSITCAIRDGAFCLSS
jgi:predicted metal-binding protein